MISTTIKKIYFDPIIDGEKKHEYKPDSEYWRKRLGGKDHDKIGFLCGKIYRVYAVLKIEYISCPAGLEWLGTERVFDITLGDEIKENE